ncbi:CRE-SRB-17 protein [Aphelenchoides avenae]|nr:CRE-SRB-17 protein [Aphelenchus avenae]
MNICSAAAEFAYSAPLVTTQLLQAVFSVFALLLFVLNLSVSGLTGQKRFPVHPSLKLIVVCGSLFYLLFSGFMVVGQVLRMMNGVLNSDLCPYLSTTWKCLLPRIPGYFAIVGFCIFHRTVYGWGIVAVLLMVAVPSAWNYILFYDADFSARESYCMSTSRRNAGKLLVTSYTLIGLDIIASIGDFFLWRKNRRDLASVSKGEKYCLSRSFQWRENKLSMRLMFPLSVTHSATFVLYLCFSTISRMAVDRHANELLYITLIECAHLIVCAYTGITLLAFYWLRRRLGEFHKVDNMDSTLQAEIYFTQLRKQLSGLA